MLNYGSGVEYEGETPPDRSQGDQDAITVWNMLSNGQGGIDWAGLDLAVALIGITEIDLLIARLVVIKTHKTPES